MIDNTVLILIFICLFMVYYNTTEKFENTQQCSDVTLNKAIYKYNINTINRNRNN